MRELPTTKNEILKWANTTYCEEFDGYLIVCKEEMFYWFVRIFNRYRFVMSSFETSFYKEDIVK